MSVRRLQPAILGAILLVSGCALPQRHIADRNQDTIRLASYEQQVEKTVYVVGHGWHTGLVLRVSDVSPDTWPKIRDFSDMHFVELGWGDECRSTISSRVRIEAAAGVSNSGRGLRRMPLF